MYEYFHCLILLNGHYTSYNVELGVFNVQVVSKTSQEGLLHQGTHIFVGIWLLIPCSWYPADFQNVNKQHIYKL